MRNSTECTGLRAEMTMTAEAISQRTQKKNAATAMVHLWPDRRPRSSSFADRRSARQVRVANRLDIPFANAQRNLAVGRVERDVPSDLALPAVAVVEQPFLVVE